MKRISLILILTLAISQGFSQVFTLGPKVGLNYSKLVFDETFTEDGVNFSYITQDAKVGAVLGAFFRLNLGPFHFQPEVLFSQNLASVEVGSLSFSQLQNIKINRVDVPLLIGFNLGRAVRLSAGPVMTHVLDIDAEPSILNTGSSAVQNFDENTWGYQVGLGFDIKRFTLDLRYEGNLSKLGMDVTVGDETFNFDYRERTLQTSIGFKLIK